MNIKKYIVLIGILIIAIGCSSTKQVIDDNKMIIRNIVTSFIEYRNKDNRIDPKENILIVGVNVDANRSHRILLTFDNPKLMTGFNYSKVYEINGYKLIIADDMNGAYLIENVFKEVPYEDFNLAKMAITYETITWHITLNSKNEVVEVLPQEKVGIIKNILEKKGVKFSKDYVD
jgi:hypothetical protein